MLSPVTRPGLLTGTGEQYNISNDSVLTRIKFYDLTFFTMEKTGFYKYSIGVMTQ